MTMFLSCVVVLFASVLQVSRDIQDSSLSVMFNTGLCTGARTKKNTIFFF